MALRTIAVLAVVAGLAGCSSSKSTATSSSGSSSSAAKGTPAAAFTIKDPCRLLTQEEASTIMGAKVGPGETHNIPPVIRCGYFTKSQDELFLDVSGTETFDDSPAAGFTPVAGVGDKAAWQHDQFGSHLTIVKGPNMITLGLPPSVHMDNAAVEKFGKLIASRM